MGRFADWLVTAKPGESFVYFEGNLGETRAKWQSMDEAERVAVRPRLDEAADAWAAYRKGDTPVDLVALTQVREGPNVCSYLATRTRKGASRHAAPVRTLEAA